MNDDEHKPDACYGVMCPKRSTCQLHADLGLVDGTVIESCQQGRLWPLYRHVAGEAMD